MNTKLTITCDNCGASITYERPEVPVAEGLRTAIAAGWRALDGADEATVGTVGEGATKRAFVVFHGLCGACVILATEARALPEPEDDPEAPTPNSGTRRRDH